MIISISGTPGTGKTEVARILAKKLNYKLVSIKSLIKKVKTAKDKERNVKIVDVRDIQKKTPKEKNMIIEGHLSHLLKSDLLVILRTRPDILEKRLKKRHWKKKKIIENVEAEILDEITIESLKNKRIMEIDTTNKKEELTAKIIISTLNKLSLLKKYRPGKISWSEKFKDYLFRNE